MRTLIRLAVSLLPTRLRQYVPDTFTSQPPTRPPSPYARPSSSDQHKGPEPDSTGPPEAAGPDGISNRHPEHVLQAAQAAQINDELLSTKVFARRMGVSEQTVRNWYQKGKIHGVRSGGGYKFPSSQIMPATQSRPKQLVPGLDAVFGRFPNTTQAWDWLTTETTALRTRSKTSDTPLQALRRGRRARILELADSKQQPI